MSACALLHGHARHCSECTALCAAFAAAGLQTTTPHAFTSSCRSQTLPLGDSSSPSAATIIITTNTVTPPPPLHPIPIRSRILLLFLFAYSIPSHLPTRSSSAASLTKSHHLCSFLTLSLGPHQQGVLVICHSLQSPQPSSSSVLRLHTAAGTGSGSGFGTCTRGLPLPLRR